MRILRRYLVLGAVLFWLGGFTFYAAVVVPVGTAALGNSSLRQGFVTREVTRYLNLSAAVALVVLAGDVLLARDASVRRRAGRVGLWVLMALCQAVLFWLHAYLDARMRRRGLLVLEPEMFYLAHRTYLWVHTAQWAAGLAFLWLMLQAWRSEDQAQADQPVAGGRDAG